MIVLRWLAKPRVGRVALAVAVAIGSPLGWAMMNLTARDLDHPGTWFAAAFVAIIGSLGALLHGWATSRDQGGTNP